MSQPKQIVGSISWCDLTVADASGVRDFYAAVTGWQPEPVAMGDYEDFCMKTPDGESVVAGVCHARGMNADLPPQWLVYITVADLSESVRQCLAHGGKVLHQRTGPEGRGGMAVIQDPAGAVAALFQPPPE